jgi:hypothetical protein
VSASDPVLALFTGSDCMTGKQQFATREVAQQSAKAGRARGWTSMQAYQCPLCRCWHVGNRRNSNSKQRGRR